MARSVVSSPSPKPSWTGSQQHLSGSQVGCKGLTQLERSLSGLALDEIAGLTAASGETVKSRLRYAYRRLRAALEDMA